MVYDSNGCGFFDEGGGVTICACRARSLTRSNALHAAQKPTAPPTHAMFGLVLREYRIDGVAGVFV